MLALILVAVSDVVFDTDGDKVRMVGGQYRRIAFGKDKLFFIIFTTFSIMTHQ